MNKFILFLQYLPTKDIVEVSNSSLDFDGLNINLESFGITEGKKLIIYSILSAILNLGNIEFGTSKLDDDSCFILEESRVFLNNVAALLNIDKRTLEDALVIKIYQIAGSQIRYSLFYCIYFQQVDF